MKELKFSSQDPILVANWKMHKTIEETEQFIHQLSSHIKNISFPVFIAPSFTAIAAAAKAARSLPLHIGGQNASEHEQGAFTGEISAHLLKEAGASFVILGHSERRQYFHENNALIHRKVQRALMHHLPVILCVGETEGERSQGKTETVLKEQILHCLESITVEQFSELCIAYEPIWAIGTGKSATAPMAAEAHVSIRKVIGEKWGKKCAQNCPILYGGSVKAENISTFLEQVEINGALIGGAALDVQQFAKIVSLGKKS